MPETVLYLALTIDDTPCGGVCILSASLDREKVMKMAMDYVEETGGQEAWMNLRKNDDEPPTEAEYTKRDLAERVTVLSRKLD